MYFLNKVKKYISTYVVQKLYAQWFLFDFSYLPDVDKCNNVDIYQTQQG